MHRWTRSAALLTCLLSVALYAGCNKPQDSGTKGSNPGTTPSTPAGDGGGHSHEGAGPAGGTIFDLASGKYHAEFCMDHGKKKATVYIRGSDAKKLLPVKADKLILEIDQPKFQIELMPERQPTDPEGKCSCFSGTHPNFGTEQEFAGTVSGLIDGQPCKGPFAEKPHSDGKK